MIYFWHDNDDYVLNIHYDSASLDPSKKIGGVETAAEVPAYSPPSGKRGKLKWDPILEEFSWEYIDKVFPPVDEHAAIVASDAVSGHVKSSDVDEHGNLVIPVPDLSGYAETAGTYPNLRAQATTKADVGLANVDNVKQLPIAGGTMTGILYPQQNTSYTTGQARRIHLSTSSSPSGWGNGDVWLVYE